MGGLGRGLSRQGNSICKGSEAWKSMRALMLFGESTVFAPILPMEKEVICLMTGWDPALYLLITRSVLHSPEKHLCAYWEEEQEVRRGGGGGRIWGL